MLSLPTVMTAEWDVTTPDSDSMRITAILKLDKGKGQERKKTREVTESPGQQKGREHHMTRCMDSGKGGGNVETNLHMPNLPFQLHTNMHRSSSKTPENLLETQFYY